ncbi:hypothetical protein MLD38_034693 [Melastoma candidum]|uniref:Uncharacterized protein n=1 Tax=Melastoma candidum TaxID=119954 RepID=A0ACB9MBA4_9MYRT|nr:hypothetical protein MLD38_034693 [Melastoma candidum]
MEPSSCSCLAQMGTLKAGGLGLCGRSSADQVPAIRQLRPYIPLRIVRGGLCSDMFELASSGLASAVFSVGTFAVLPFYTLMVAAPKAEMTQKCIRSCIPFIALGLLYTYLLYLSWTPDTLGLMFASKYWLHELPGIARMFSNEMTLGSTWIHLLAVDLFAARFDFS